MVNIDLKVGDQIVKLCHFYGTDHISERMVGTVIYIHPKREFYRVRFNLKNGTSIVEGYRFYGDEYSDFDWMMLGSDCLTWDEDNKTWCVA